MGWHTILNAKEDNLNIIKVCEDIQRRDETFSYHIHNGYICILSSTKDQAHKRGMWFKYRAAAKGYTVVED